MPSIQSKIFNGFLKAINIKTLINKTAKNRNRRRGVFFSNAERNEHHILTVKIDEKEVSVMGEDRKAPKHIIYFHGGMYTMEANSGHKRWLFQLFERVICKITFVDYPLAPENTVLETVKMVVHTYQFLTDRFPDDTFILMGDSAGGGLAMVLAQYLRDHNFGRRPGTLILYSPWVRLDMQNPLFQSSAQNDIILDSCALQKSALAYAGEYDLSHPFLSPYFSSCKDLGDIHVFYGGEEMLAPDISMLDEKCRQENVQSTFHCYPGMQHVFHLFSFLPESKAVLEKTIEILDGHQQKNG